MNSDQSSSPPPPPTNARDLEAWLRDPGASLDAWLKDPRVPLETKLKVIKAKSLRVKKA